MKCISLVLLCIGSSLALPTTNQDPLGNPKWKAWKQFHGKDYSDDGEERVRNFIWQDNLKRIIAHNEEGHKYKLAMNHLGDFTAQEVKDMLLGYKEFKRPNGAAEKGATFLTPANMQAPDNIDWREQGYVTPVKNQGQCGSCWSFSATGALEGQHFRKTGKLVSLSEQNLVDCSASFGNNGCHGGLMDNAFRYIKANGGIDTEASYPYLAEVGQCRYNASDSAAEDTGYVDVPQGNEDALKSAIASVGPVSVAIDASHSSFQFYHTGVYNEPACSSTKLDHGVLAVGYGTENGQDYWLIKNSWGTTWGDEGYIKIARNAGNECGVASCASYPLV